MQALDDMPLLREYAAHGSEAAFAELVSRRIGFVYSSALRQLRDPNLAEEAAQAVFILLAQKAGRISGRTILTGWLFKTTRFVALAQMRTSAKRRQREQEAHMQTELHAPAPDPVWEQISPLLDEALASLGEKDRQAVLLRFFENKSLAEVGDVLGAGEDTARKRVSRALDKLRKHFSKRGVSSTAAIIAGSISANSVQVPPVALAKSVTAIALAKGAAASGSTLTIVKGALKIMAWTKVKTAIVASVGVLLVAGSTTVTVKEIEEHRPYSWQLPHFVAKNFNDASDMLQSILEQTQPQVRIAPTIHPEGLAIPATPESGIRAMRGTSAGGVSLDRAIIHTNPVKCLGFGYNVHDMIQLAYDDDVGRAYASFTAYDHHTIFAAPLPSGGYDFIANLPNGALQALQAEITKRFGLVGSWRMVETNVLVLKLANPEVQGFKPAGSLMREMNLNTNNLGGLLPWETGTASRPEITRSDNALCYTTHRFNAPLSVLIETGGLERIFGLPIVDETGLTNRYDFTTTLAYNIPKEPGRGFGPGAPEADKEAWTQALTQQLGLELVPAQRPVRMLVVERAK